MCGFIDFFPHTFLQNQKTEIVLFSILHKHVFDASDLLFTGGKLFLEKGMLSKMFYFKLLKKCDIYHQWILKSETLNTFFYLKKYF